MTNNQVANKDLIVGLDIGTSKVVCLVGRYDSSENLEILSLGTYPSSGLKKGVVVNIDATTDAIEIGFSESFVSVLTCLESFIAPLKMLSISSVIKEKFFELYLSFCLLHRD